MEHDSVYWVWLQLLFGVATRRAARIMEYFSHPREIYDGIAAGTAAVAMLTGDELRAAEPCFVDARAVVQRARKNGCVLLTPDHPAYPALLRSLPDRPAVLYCKGDPNCLQEAPAVGMVGARKFTPYGRKAAEFLAGGLALAGVVVVSGLAHGVDTACHQAALAAGGKTVGVLGCGLDIDYPHGSGPLKTAMSRSGAVITEYPFGTPSNPLHFPLRNRILSGICRATVVVEADERSGSLITARLAREQGRELFAVPGPILERACQGSNALLREGARPALCVDDVLAVFPDHISPAQAPANARDTARTLQAPVRQQAPPDAGSARAVYDALGAGQLTVDGIAQRTALSATDILTALTELELGGHIQSHPGRRFGLR